jgi:predicted dehydrogenase
MSKLTRRRFVQSAAAASAVFPLFTVAGTKASGKVIGANDTIRLGVAGINGRGQSHIDAFAGADKVQVSYLIDPDSRLFESRGKKVRDKGGNTPTCVQDIRRALDDDNLDAVSVATCNHWHSLITVWACQAGKDVYVEKPISHNVFEGRKCVEAAAKYGRVVQHGTQQRSSQGRADEIAAIQSGKYGKLLVSKGYCCKPRWSIGVKPPSAPSADFDFNLWLGPAPEQEFHGNLHPYNWHWFWDTGNGDTGNQGVHEMDVARWAIKGSTLPNKVWSLGGRYIPGETDQGQTPNMQLAVYEYDDCMLLFETRGLVGKKGAPGNMVTNEFYTTDGVIKGGKFYPSNGGAAEAVKGQGPKVTGGGAFGSFIAAVRSRKPQDINCDAEVAHYSSALCHLANISFRLGESAPFSKQAQSVGDNKLVVESFNMLKDNLKAVNVDLGETTYQLGRTLTMNPKTEQFVDDDEANRLLTRPYRAPFVVPQQV